MTATNNLAEQPNAYLFKPLSQPRVETAIPEIISHPVSVGRNVRRPADIQIRDIAYVMQAIKQGFYEGYHLKKAIETIRNMSDKEAARNAKSTLPWFSPSLFDGRRANENFLRARFMVFDIDHVGVPANANSPLPNVASASDGTQGTLVSVCSGAACNRALRALWQTDFANPLLPFWKLKHIMPLNNRLGISLEKLRQ